MEIANKEWDLYYMNLAKAAAWNSKCLSRKIGAVLVNPKTNTVIGTGYNGPPVGTPHCDEQKRLETLEGTNWFKSDGICVSRKDLISRHLRKGTMPDCPRRLMGFASGEGLDVCVAGHAERNAIISAAKNGCSTKDCVLYCYCGTPCKNCAIEIINSAISEVVCIGKETRDYDDVARTLFQQAGVVVRRIDEKFLKKVLGDG